MNKLYLQFQPIIRVIKQMSITTKTLHSVRAVAGILFVSMTLSACSSLGSLGSVFSQEQRDATEGMSANTLYQNAKEALNGGDYEGAIKLYETLEARYPLGRFAQQAQLESAYAYYKYDEPETALDMIDRFVRMNPTSKKLDYAFYLRGLVNFNRGSSILDRIFPRKIADLDTVQKKEAFQDFSRVINRFPASKYAPDAKLRLRHLSNTLAESEVNVAKYYMVRGAWLAAFNRAEYAIKHYQGSPAIIDALEIKVRSARQLGKFDIAADNMRVLETNFPERAARLKAQLR